MTNDGPGTVRLKGYRTFRTTEGEGGKSTVRYRPGSTGTVPTSYSSYGMDVLYLVRSNLSGNYVMAGAMCNVQFSFLYLFVGENWGSIFRLAKDLDLTSQIRTIGSLLVLPSCI